MSVAEAAQRIGISASKLYQLAAARAESPITVWAARSSSLMLTSTPTSPRAAWGRSPRRWPPPECE